VTPTDRSHCRPRTRNGRVAVAAFLACAALAQPPVVHVFADRIEPWLFGAPFLFVYLLAAYSAAIGVLIWAWRKGL